MELVEGQEIGPYRLVGRAGSGGMAEVWRAFDARLKRYVAVKFLSPRFATDPAYLERFSREAQAISRLDHPNILPIFDFGEQDGWTYMVSPFIGGGTLASRLQRGPWTVSEAVDVLAPLAAALDYAHEQGIVHRDVKPSNVLVGDRDRLVLSDFGIARIVESTTMLSQAGLIIGTPMYMSPEQADGQTAGPASDLYSLGVIAYEMLTGRPPFLAETPIALLRAHIDKPLPPPRSLNPQLVEAAESVLFIVLAKDPSHRFASGAAFAAALRSTVTARSGPPAASVAQPVVQATTPLSQSVVHRETPLISDPAMAPAANSPSMAERQPTRFTSEVTRSAPIAAPHAPIPAGVLDESAARSSTSRVRDLFRETALLGGLLGLLSLWFPLLDNQRVISEALRTAPPDVLSPVVTFGLYDVGVGVSTFGRMAGIVKYALLDIVLMGAIFGEWVYVRRRRLVPGIVATSLGTSIGAWCVMALMLTVVGSLTGLAIQRQEFDFSAWVVLRDILLEFLRLHTPFDGLGSVPYADLMIIGFAFAAPAAIVLLAVGVLVSINVRRRAHAAA